MADPYEYPSATPKAKRSGISIMTIIGVLFAIFMVWQVMTTLGEADEKIEQLSIQEGDTIEYHYVARLPDGRLHDTSRLEVAQQANQSLGFEMKPAFTYAVQTATIDPDSPGLPWAGADEAVAGAHVGQTVTFTATEGGWEPFTPNSPGIPREMLPQFFQRTVFLQEAQAAAAEGNPPSQGFNLTSLNNQIGPLTDGFVFNAGRGFPPSWDIVIDDVNFDNRSITFTHTVQDGQSFEVPQLGGEVTVLLRDDESSLVYRLDIPQGTTFAVAQGDELQQAGFTPGSYRVASIDDEHINFDYNPSPDPSTVGQPLTIELQVVRKVTDGASVGIEDDGHTGHTH